MALPTASTPIAKSLHTITVLQQVATFIWRSRNDMDEAGALEQAMTILGLAGRPDPYGLQARALAVMTPKGA
jgi:hypothetical protein